jgi:hypothetical protein
MVHSKICSRCKQSKSISDFYDASGKIGGSCYCKQCSTEKRREHRRSKPELVRKANLKACYGLSPEKYDQMVDDQNNSCAICRTNNIKLFVDHNHSTGTVRGLLCHHCNSMLGYAKEDPTIMVRGVQYLNDNGFIKGGF